MLLALYKSAKAILSTEPEKVTAVPVKAAGIIKPTKPLAFKSITADVVEFMSIATASTSKFEPPALVAKNVIYNPDLNIHPTAKALTAY